MAASQHPGGFPKAASRRGIGPFADDGGRTFVGSSLGVRRPRGLDRDGRSRPVRVEAAAWQGRVVALERQLPWKVTAPSNDASRSAYISFLSCCRWWRPPWPGATFAWAGDKRGANRLAGFVLVCTLTAELLGPHHVPSGVKVESSISRCGIPCSLPVIVWLVYVAFEPYLRRYVPNTLIGWSRLLEGRWRDPLVGGHLLAGRRVGIGCVCSLPLARENPAAGVSLPVDGSRSVAWLLSQVLAGIAVIFCLRCYGFCSAFRPAAIGWRRCCLSVIRCLAAPHSSRPDGAPYSAFLVFSLYLALGIQIIVRLGVLATVAFLFTVYCASWGALPGPRRSRCGTPGPRCWPSPRFWRWRSTASAPRSPDAHCGGMNCRRTLPE